MLQRLAELGNFLKRRGSITSFAPRHRSHPPREVGCESGERKEGEREVERQKTQRREEGREKGEWKTKEGGRKQGREGRRE